MSIKVGVVTDKIDLADELEEDFHAVALEAVGEAGDMLLLSVQRHLGRRRGTAQSVAPEGEPPEFDRGDLFRSFRRIAPTIRGRTATSGIYSNHPGANRLEYGKTDARGIRTLPHPYARPAMEETEPQIQRLFAEQFGAE